MSTTCSNSIDRISDLPTEILHRILYFLSQEDAVRTSVLSKSWRYIWCTRPNLDFSNDPDKCNEQEFLSIVNKNLQRYCDQRLSLEEFHLRILLGDSRHESVWLLEKWIPLLTNMGVKKFCLSIRRRYCTPRHVELPPLIFGTESLQELYIENFILDQKAIQRMVPFNHLRVLSLDRVSIEDEIFQQIVSMCPLIETTFLDSCKVLQNIKVNNLCHLKEISFSKIPFPEEEQHCTIEIYPPSLETIKIRHCNLRSHKGYFRNLKDLDMWGVKSSWDHLFSSKFPSLKRLTLWDCYGLQEIKLFIDAPNIKSFSFEGDFIPSISFAATTSKWWSSNIDLKYLPSNDASLWFFKLKGLLKSLSQSRIYLSIDEYSMNDEDIVQENIHLVQDTDGCANKPVAVERLYLDYCHLSSFPSLLNHALSICRPRIIDEYRSSGWKIDDMEYRGKILMERRSNGDQEDQFKKALWLQDLEEVSMKILLKKGWQWHSITTLSELPNYSQETVSYLRFQLKWRELRSVRSLKETKKVEDLEDLRIENLDKPTEPVEDLEDLRIESLDRRTEPVGTWDKLVRMICNCFCIPLK